MPAREAYDQLAKRFEEFIRTIGWGVQGVGAGEDAPQFAYTIGLSRSYHHPEIITFGLSFQTAHAVLNDIGAHVRDGRVYQATDVCFDIIRPEPTLDTGGEWPVTFKMLTPAQRKRHMGIATLVLGSPFQALQLIWPDTNGRLPGEENFDERFAKMQPILG